MGFICEFDGCDSDTENVDTYATPGAIHVAAQHAPGPELDKGASKVRLSAMKQHVGEPVRRFVSRLRNVAKIGDYSITCPRQGCGFEMTYTESVIKNQVVIGLANAKTQQDILADIDMDKVDLETLVRFIESKESVVSRAGPSQDQISVQTSTTVKHTTDNNKYCSSVSKEAKVLTKKSKKKLPAQDCIIKEANKTGAEESLSQDKIKKLLAQDCKTKDGEKIRLKERNDPLPAQKSKTLAAIMTIMVGATISTTMTSDTVYHHVYDGSSHSWQRKPAKRKPLVRVKTRLDKEACQILGMRNINLQAEETQERALPDTGASVTMAGTKFMRSLGQSEANLAKCDMRLYGADNNDIKLLGVIPVIITDTVTGPVPVTLFPERHRLQQEEVCVCPRGGGVCWLPDHKGRGQTIAKDI